MKTLKQIFLEAEKTVAQGLGGKSTAYNPDERPENSLEKGSPESIGQAASIVRQKYADRDFGDVQNANQLQGDWSPQNPEGQFSQSVQKTGLFNTMKTMPPAELQKHFGVKRPPKDDKEAQMFATRVGFGNPTVRAKGPTSVRTNTIPISGKG